MLLHKTVERMATRMLQMVVLLDKLPARLFLGVTMALNRMFGK